MIESINLGSYPYTYVRTVTMKSKLFKKNDYDKLLKMEIHELTKYLQETNYGIEINDFEVERAKDEANGGMVRGLWT